MTHNRHTYRVETHSGPETYTVRAVPAGDEVEGDRVSRDEAIELARDVDATVFVEPCECGADAISIYAGEHPRSVLAIRVDEKEGVA